MSDEDLAGRLAELLLEVGQLVASALASAGQPLAVTEQRLAVNTNEQGTAWSSSHVLVETNVLSLPPLPQFGPALADWLEEARTFAGEIADRYSKWIPMWTAIMPVGLELFGLDPQGLKGDDPEQGAFHCIVLRVAHWYLTHMPSLAVPDLALARRLAVEAVDVVTTGRLMARQTIAVDGIEPERDLLECGDNRLRALSPLERGALLPPPSPRRGLGLLGGVPRLACPEHVLEMECDVRSPREVGQLPVPPLVLALQLHQIEWAGPGVVSTDLLPEWLSDGHGFRSLPTQPYLSPRSKLSQKQFEDAGETAKLLSKYQLEPPGQRSELALHRFTLGCGRVDQADRLIDFVVALEALLLPYDKEARNSNLSYRFSLHGAFFLAEADLERRTVFEGLKKLYDTRSRLVHGGGYPDRAETMAAAGDARRLAARGLLKAVHEGFPDPREFNRLVLG
ncbi:MAG: hypothetical protein ACYDCB_12055 [Candidatus Dormibacteria bacterium]